MNGLRRIRSEQGPALVLVLLILVGAAALAFIYATFPGKYEQEMEFLEVTEGEVEIRRSPKASSGVTHRIFGGTLHPVRKGRREGWVYVIVRDGCEGWVEVGALAASTQRTTGR